MSKQELSSIKREEEINSESLPDVNFKGIIISIKMTMYEILSLKIYLKKGDNVWKIRCLKS